jgi:hypothetical protein
MDSRNKRSTPRHKSNFARHGWMANLYRKLFFCSSVSIEVDVFNRATPNALDRSACRAFFKLSDGIEVVAERRARSNQPLGGFA